MKSRAGTDVGVSEAAGAEPRAPGGPVQGECERCCGHVIVVFEAVLCHLSMPCMAHAAFYGRGMNPTAACACE